MFRIVCDPSSGNVERPWLKLLVIFFLCVVGVWQRNFEPAVCVPGTTSWELQLGVFLFGNTSFLRCHSETVAR